MGSGNPWELAGSGPWSPWASFTPDAFSSPKKKRKKAHLHFNTVELKGLAHRMVFNRQVYSQALKLLQMVT